MAHAIANTDLYPKGGALTSIAAWVTDTIRTIGETNPRLVRVRTLQAMTDAQLAALGVERDQIVHLVFRDAYYR